jgi:hypothetical protein
VKLAVTGSPLLRGMAKCRRLIESDWMKFL